MKTNSTSAIVCLLASFQLTANAITLTLAGYSQDFNTLANSGTSSTVPSGWAFLESPGNTTYAAGTGSSATGDTYSFGASGSSERALGELTTGTVNSRFGAQFDNGAGGAIDSLTITYTGEQWRWGATSRSGADRLDFQYSLDASSLGTGTWIDADALDFASVITSGGGGALDGNAAANRSLISATISGLNIPAGANFWIRWLSTDVTGSDDGLAIDDLSIAAKLASVSTDVPETGSTLGILALGLVALRAAQVSVRRQQLGWPSSRSLA
jgi:hypothetical protein